MSRRPPNWAEADDRSRGQRQAALDRKKQLVAAMKPGQRAAMAAMKSAQSVPPQPTELDPLTAARFGDIIANLKLWTVEQAEVKPASAVQSLAALMLDVTVSRRSCAVLSWPASGLSLAAAHAVAGRGLLSMAARGGLGQSVSLSLRTLTFPYSIRTRTPLRDVFVDRSSLHQACTRQLNDDDLRSGPLYANLLRYVRAKDLNGRVRGGGHHFEYEHPDLEELVALRCTKTERPVMHRIAKRTDLPHLSTSEDAGANLAPFAVSGLASGENLSALAGGLSGLNLVLLDLTRSGRNRCRRDWRSETAALLETVRGQLGHLPVLALTEDTWVHRVLGWELLRGYDEIPGKAPARMTAILARSSAVASTQTEAFDPPSEVGRWEAHGFADSDGSLLEDLASAARRAVNLHDLEAARLMTDLAGVVRRTAALPGGVGALGRYVEAETDQAKAAELMEPYRAGRLLQAGKALDGPFAQRRRPVLADVLERVRRTLELRRTSPPLGHLVRDVVAGRLNASTRTIVWLPKPMIAEFAEFALKEDPEIGERVRTKLKKHMLVFVDAIAFHELAFLSQAERASTKVLIVVAPNRADMSRLASEPWLPERVVVLADGYALGGIGREVARLAAFDAFEAYRPRLAGLAAAAQAEAGRVLGHGLDLADAEPAAEPDFPESAVVDLAGPRHPGDRVVRLVTDGRQTLLARRRTKILVYDEDRAIPTFTARSAEDVDVGEKICVINEAFVEMARTQLDIRAAAAEEIRHYHELVQRRFGALTGLTKTARVEQLLAAMARPGVSFDRANRWVSLETEQYKPLDIVVPRAPRDHATFKAFMRALSVPDDLAAHYWWWAVIATRKGRIRAALQLHDAYVSILVDPLTADHVAPERRAEIRSLRRAAEGHVTTVIDKVIDEVAR